MADKGYSLIITVDNGIKANEAIDCANELGIDVIVSDHHNCSMDDLPNAYAIIHPMISPDYPYKGISGGFVAYKLASALLKRHDKYLFSLAAITTISDMMPLLDENRSLVKRALQFMEENKYPQLELLLGNNPKYNVTSIGFTIAPKINSFGRLSEVVNPNHLVKYFSQEATMDILKAVSTKAIEINSLRQEMTNKQYQTLLQSVCAQDEFLYSYQNEIHEGLIGLVAGKYTREFKRPSFVMCLDKNTNMYKGSARAIEGISLNEIFMATSDCLVGYGGHELAGGFSVLKENVDLFKTRLDSYLHEKLENYQPPKVSALMVNSDEITRDSVKQLELLEPLGNGNEETYFYFKDIAVKKVVSLSNGKHLRFDLDLPKARGQALYFNQGKLYEQYCNVKTISLIGKLNINVFNQIESVNIVIEEIK